MGGEDIRGTVCHNGSALLVLECRTGVVRTVVVATVKVRDTAGRCLLHRTHVPCGEPRVKEESFLLTFVLWPPHKHLRPCACTHVCVHSTHVHMGTHRQFIK